MSVSSTAVSLARSTLGELSGKTALVVSAGEAGKLTARTLASSGVSRMLVTSRNAERSAELAAELGGSTVPFERLPSALSEADIVITSTAAPHFLIERPMVEAAMSGRPNRPLLVIDIAVPRDVEPGVREVRGVHLHDIDDLQAVARESMQLRRKELTQAEAIVDEEVAKFGDWLRSLEVVPTVASLRSRAEAVRIAELERTLAKTKMSDGDRRRVEAMTSALVKKLLHTPISRLKQPGEGERYVETARALFGLDEDGAG
jgi:glutamyl-tRNA reductase